MLGLSPMLCNWDAFWGLGARACHLGLAAAFDVHMLVSAVLSVRAALSGIEEPAWFARIASRGSRMGRG